LTEKAKIGVMILAAGASSRLGYPKQLVKFRGKFLLQHIIDTIESLNFDPKVVVLGAKSDEIIDKIVPGNFEVVINDHWELGMSSSIKKGLHRLLELENELDYILVLLSDQPYVNKEKIMGLISVQLKGNVPATFSEYTGDIGVPAIFSAKVFPFLKELKGDQGARKLIVDKKFEFQAVKFEGGNFDVDTTKDVELLKQLEKQ
jgi:molybdenum cofactor cytidylyltransferase